LGDQHANATARTKAGVQQTRGDLQFSARLVETALARTDEYAAQQSKTDEGIS